MRVELRHNTPVTLGNTSAHLVLVDPDTNLPVAEIAVRGAGYVVLSEEEREIIAATILAFVANAGGLAESADSPAVLVIPDRVDGYHGEPPLWQTTAAEQAAKRGTPARVTKVGGKKVKVYESLEDIPYPEGAKFGEDGIIIVPSRKGEDADGKRFRRACKRARAQQQAFLQAQSDPESVEDGEAEEDSDES